LLTAKQKNNKLQDSTIRNNIGLKQLADSLGIEKNITTYTARHSHATALVNSGASLEFIMDQFKHASMQTTMNYVDFIDDSKRKDMAKLL
jgi:site-specific recombinase XerD